MREGNVTYEEKQGRTGDGDYMTHGMGMVNKSR